MQHFSVERLWSNVSASSRRYCSPGFSAGKGNDTRKCTRAKQGNKCAWQDTDPRAWQGKTGSFGQWRSLHKFTVINSDSAFISGLGCVFCCWFQGHTSSVSAPMAGTKSGTLISLFTLSVVHEGTPLFLQACRGHIVLSGHWEAQNPRMSSDSRAQMPEEPPAIRRWCSTETGYRLSGYIENKNKLNAVGWSSLQPNF